MRPKVCYRQPCTIVRVVRRVVNKLLNDLTCAPRVPRRLRTKQASNSCSRKDIKLVHPHTRHKLRAPTIGQPQPLSARAGRANGGSERQLLESHVREGAQSEAIRAILTLGERIASQSEAIRALV